MSEPARHPHLPVAVILGNQSWQDTLPVQILYFECVISLVNLIWYNFKFKILVVIPGQELDESLCQWNNLDCSRMRGHTKSSTPVIEVFICRLGAPMLGLGAQSGLP